MNWNNLSYKGILPGDHTLGMKKYELTNHLGNVMSVVSDKKMMVTDANDSRGYHYEADLISSQDYYPFGMLMRSSNPNAYRFGMNGQEKSDELTGITGSHYRAMFWEYNAITGRRWNLDPKPKAWESWYSTFGGNPILNSDLLGDFSPPVHSEMINNSSSTIKLSNHALISLIYGVQDADYIGFSRDFHFDNRANYNQIKDNWKDINTRINSNIKSGDAYSLGYDIHTTQDFYAHSNYVELYVKFYQSQGGDMSKFDANNIPIYDDGVKNNKFNEFLKNNNLRTGTFDDLSNEKMPWTNKDKLNKDTHFRINKDDNKSLKGKERVKGTNVNYHKLAKNVAQRHTNKILKSYSKSRKY